MKGKTKWILALLFTIAVIGIVKLEERKIMNADISEYITTGKDFLVMKKWVSSYFNTKDDDLLTVHYNEQAFAQYESIQPYREGAIVSYTQPFAIEAERDGLIIFTGITRKTGKTITVLYDDGDEVTYGFVGSFSKLPYTSVKRGDTIALMDEEMMFLMVKQNGEHLSPSLLPAYLSGTMK